SNGFMKALLRSPLHGMMSANTLVITLTGRKTGKPVSTPVNYVEDGKQLIITSKPDRSWWRNARGGADVELQLRGHKVTGRAQVVEEPTAVAIQLGRYLGHVPQFAKYFGVKQLPDGSFDPGDLAKAAGERVVVLVDLP
ncbi:MAG TPA: nitroreductase family deazaflavin-dependent oxidoreductase, partial [Longilinea sp.]|nr:nitroreductase family deazaflavin-dependent oxidoreductase [Longilinea sp.]